MKAMCSIAEILYQGLQKEGLLYNTNIAAKYSMHFSYYRDFVKDAYWLQEFPIELKKRYESNISINCMRYALAAKNFHKPLEREAVSAAIAFVVAGCCLDNMLDSGILEERQLALDKLNWDYCAHYFVTFGTRKALHPVDMLYEAIGSFLCKKSEIDYSAYKKLMQYLKRAAFSEQRSVDCSDFFSDEYTVRDKSVLFVVIGFLLALYGRHTSLEEKTFFLIGDIFRSIDDLCDFEEDKSGGSVNSLFIKKGTMEISDTIKIVQELQWLHNALQQLSGYIEAPFYEFIKFNLQLWTLENPYIYQKFLAGDF